MPTTQKAIDLLAFRCGRAGRRASRVQNAFGLLEDSPLPRAPEQPAGGAMTIAGSYAWRIRKRRLHFQ